MATTPEDDKRQPSRPGRKPVTIDLDSKDVKDKTPAKASGSEKAETSPGTPDKTGASSTASSPSGTDAGKSASPAKTGMAGKAATAASEEPAKGGSTGAGSDKKTGDKAAPAAKTAAGPSDKPDPAKTAAAPAGGTKTDKPAASKAEAPKAETSKAETSKTGAPKTAAPGHTGEKPARRGGLVGGFAAALLGGVVALAGGYGLQVSGVLPAPGATETVSPDQITYQNDRIAALEAALDKVRSANTGAQAAAADVSALESRVDALESAKGNTAGADDLAPRLAALDSRVANLSKLETDVADLRRLVQSGTQGPDVALESLQSELAALKAQVAALPKAANDQSGLADAMTALSGRVAAAEAAIAAIKPAEAVDTALAPVRDQLTSLKSTLDDQAATLDAVKASAEKSAADLATVQDSVSALSSRLDAVEKVVGGPTARETAARAVAVSSLARAVDAGRPYRTELAALSGVIDDKSDLDALAAHAETGIATKDALVGQFPALADKALAAVRRASGDSGFLDRLMSNAESVVTVRTTGDVAGTGVDAVIARMRGKVAAGDLAGALKEWDGLVRDETNAPAVATLEPWVKEARARTAAVRLIETVTGDVLTLLSGKDG